MILLQISAAQGPEECCLAVAKAWQRIAKDIKQHGLSSDLISYMNGAHANTYKSVLLSIEGGGVEAWAKTWEGTLQWIHPSPYRPKHPRKNWFIGVKIFLPMNTSDGSFNHGIRYEACRASGPGGQHVNKTDSAVCATHLASGISVKVQTERSQHANKKLAALLIAQKLAEIQEQEEDKARHTRHQSHYGLERGAAKRVFKGIAFT